MRFAPGEQATGFEGSEFEMLCVTLDAEVFVAEIFNSVAGVKKSRRAPVGMGLNNVLLQQPASPSAVPSWAPQHQSPFFEPLFQPQWYILL